MLVIFCLSVQPKLFAASIVRAAPKIQMTLEECMEYIQQDECIEVTPKHIRMRKVILNEEDRKKQQKSMQMEEVG